MYASYHLASSVLVLAFLSIISHGYPLEGTSNHLHHHSAEGTTPKSLATLSRRFDFHPLLSERAMAQFWTGSFDRMIGPPDGALIGLTASSTIVVQNVTNFAAIFIHGTDPNTRERYMTAGILQTHVEPRDDNTLRLMIRAAVTVGGNVVNVAIVAPNFQPHYQPPAGQAFIPDYPGTLADYLAPVFPQAVFGEMGYDSVMNPQESWYFAMFRDLPGTVIANSFAESPWAEEDEELSAEPQGILRIIGEGA